MAHKTKSDSIQILQSKHLNRIKVLDKKLFEKTWITMDS